MFSWFYTWIFQIDLRDIKVKFQQQNQKSLSTLLNAEYPGDNKKLLLAILGDNWPFHCTNLPKTVVIGVNYQLDVLFLLPSEMLCCGVLLICIVYSKDLIDHLQSCPNYLNLIYFSTIYIYQKYVHNLVKLYTVDAEHLPIHWNNLLFNNR